MTITPFGMMPYEATVAAGGPVTFVNRDLVQLVSEDGTAERAAPLTLTVTSAAPLVFWAAAGCRANQREDDEKRPDANEPRVRNDPASVT